MSFELIKCPICGKGFIPAPNHQLTNGHGKFVCSPGCSTAAWKRNNKRKLDTEEKARERERDKKNLYNARKRLEKNGVVHERKKWERTVYMYDRESGKFIKSFPSCTAAAREIGVCVTTISQICRGIQPSRIEYIFSYEKAESVKGYSKPNAPGASKAVLQFAKNGEFIKQYSSATEAAKAVNTSVSNITQCCNGKQKAAKGFSFMYESEFNKIDKKGNEYEDKT